jgi:dTDP-4-amino-4,6-dideoxygalactose transaminase
MVRARFEKSPTQHAPIPASGIAAAVALMRSGRLYRHNTLPIDPSEMIEPRREFAHWQGAKVCLQVESAGQAMQITLYASGVEPSDRVENIGFTPTPLQGAVAAIWGRPVLAKNTPSLVNDVEARNTLADHILDAEATFDAKVPA